VLRGVTAGKERSEAGRPERRQQTRTLGWAAAPAARVMSAPSTASEGLGRGGSLGVRFVLLAIASCALMVVDHRATHLRPLRQAFSLVVYPVQVLVDAPPRAFRWTSITLAERSALLEENERLKRE